MSTHREKKAIDYIAGLRADVEKAMLNGTCGGSDMTDRHLQYRVGVMHRGALLRLESEMHRLFDLDEDPDEDVLEELPEETK